MAENDRPAKGLEFRGRRLPEGASRELAERLERVIMRGMERALFPTEIAIRCLREIVETQALERRGQ